jgi:DNA-directed RNA polymerase alpha subunit
METTIPPQSPNPQPPMETGAEGDPELKETYGKFTCEPLERGFGTTLGNSLRRILLSSLQGAAFTHLKINGALHEFTSLSDVVEDVTDIILNLKEVLLRVEKHKEYTVRLVKEGDGKSQLATLRLSTAWRSSTQISILRPSRAVALSLSF